MMERLNDIMGRAVQRRPAHYGYNEAQAQRVQSGQPERQERREPQGPSEAVTRHLQPEPRSYPAHAQPYVPRSSRPLPEQMGRAGYAGRANNANSNGQTGRIETSERLGRVPASQPPIARTTPEQQQTSRPSGMSSSASMSHDRQNMPAIPRPSTSSAHPSSTEARTHYTRPLAQRYPRNGENTRAYQPERTLTPVSSQQVEPYHPLKTHPIPAPFRNEDYTVSPRARVDAIDTWEEDERASSMQYGDWEEDEPEIVVYQRPTTPYYEQNSYTVQPQEMTYSSQSSYPQHPMVTRNLHEVRVQEVAAHPAAYSQHPPLEPVGERHHRMTQPLDPRRTRGIGNGARAVQRADEHEYSDYRTSQDAPSVLPAQHRPIRSLRQVTHQSKEVTGGAGIQNASPSAAASTNALAPIAQSPKQGCPKCHGAGYLRADVPFGHPNFGKPIACECKEAERKEKRRQQLRDMSNMDAFRDSNFRTFNSRVPGVQEAYEVAHDFAQDPDGWLLLVGPNGCGKTHLAAAIANQSLDSGSVVLFAVVPDLLDHLRAAFAPTAKEVYDQLFSKMREAELLVLDDLGAQQSSPWANEKLFQLLNYRYNMGMPTVITANPKGLQGVDERIRSRLTDISLVTTVVMDRARDYRPMHPRRDA